MALITCSECGGMVSDKAAACPRCGAPVDAAPSDGMKAGRGHAPGGARPGFFAALARRRREKVLGWGERFGCLAILLALAGLLYIGNMLVKSQQSDYVPNAADAYAIAVMNIKSNLQARSPVKFPPVDQAETSQLDRNTFRFSSFYFMKEKDGGQRQSTRFTAVVRYTGEGAYDLYNWKMVSLDYQ